MNRDSKLRLALVLVLGVFLGCFVCLVLVPAKSQGDPNGKRTGVNVEENEEAFVDRRKVEELREQNAELSLQVDELREMIADDRAAEREEAEALKEREEALQRDKARLIERVLGKYEEYMDLSPHQYHMISEWEWEVAKYWKDFHAGKKSSEDPIPRIEDRIREILTPEQTEAYEAFLDERHGSNAQVVAQVQLGEYPASLGLSEEQKDSIYGNLYMIYHKEYSKEFNERFEVYRDEGLYDRNAATFLVAAEGVLSEEQFEALKKTLLEKE